MGHAQCHAGLLGAEKLIVVTLSELRASERRFFNAQSCLDLREPFAMSH